MEIIYGNQYLQELIIVNDNFYGIHSLRTNLRVVSACELEN